MRLMHLEDERGVGGELRVGGRLRVIVIGLGVQGNKRRQCAGQDYVASVDPVNATADFKHIEEAPLNSFDAALLCVPDEPKVLLMSYLLNHGKHVLVEKPLWVGNEEEIHYLETLARSKGLVCYTAYNHRFEPHFVRMKELIESGALGNIYHCRMFYGNGTARLVRDSAWRDQGAGVLPDLGSHLLDTAAFWFNSEVSGSKADVLNSKFEIVSSQCFENNAPDHVVFKSCDTTPQLEFEMTLLSWRNHFTCDIWAENGSAHITSLCKWGPSTFTHRTRIFPSGIPQEESVTLVQPDPTWLLEYQHFKSLCMGSVGGATSIDGAASKATVGVTDLSTDKGIYRTLQRLTDKVLQVREVNEEMSHFA